MPSALSPVRAEPTDPVRGIANDIVDALGIGRPEEAVGTPADVVHIAGLPTFKDMFPTPIDAFARVTRSMRTGGPLPTPPTPRMPALPEGLPAIPDIFGRPGEAGPASAEGDAVARAETGAVGNAQRYYQRYYQLKPPFPFPLPP